LIGILSVVESLLSQNWKPKRTVVLGFGFDEETGGLRGAAHIATALEKKFGRDGIALIVDEGGMGLEISGEMVYAFPAVAEKGYMDAFLNLEIKGGHSSRPPPHSGIGIMAEMIVELEAHPFEPRLTQENPFRQVLKCQVRYSPHEVEPWLRRALIKNESESLIGKRLAEARSNEVRYLFQTSQAVDIIKGGSKTNQLPESITAVVNYRVAPHDSLDKVKKHIAQLLSPIAHKHKLAVKGFGFDEKETESGSLLLSSKDDLQPSPISPTGPDEGVWSLFSGTIRQVFEDTDSLKYRTVVPVGDIMAGKYYLPPFRSRL
jgi:Gly-Xaa carboxypeptidase